MLIRFSLVALTISLPYLSQAAQDSLCKAEEQTAFSCMAGEKIISVCSSADATPSTGSLIYRFGLPGKAPEMTYPVSNIRPGAAFQFGMDRVLRGGTEQLSFKSGRYTYTVFSDHYGPQGEDTPLQRSGVVIEKDGKRLSTKLCTAPVGSIDMALYIGTNPQGGTFPWHTVGLPDKPPREDIP